LLVLSGMSQARRMETVRSKASATARLMRSMRSLNRKLRTPLRQTVSRLILNRLAGIEGGSNLTRVYIVMRAAVPIPSQRKRDAHRHCVYRTSPRRMDDPHGSRKRWRSQSA
jgi:hypothetical protein